MFDIQDRGESQPVACESCGRDLTSSTVSHARWCVRFDVVCANPCGLASKVESFAVKGQCVNRVEPDRWHSLESSAEPAVPLPGMPGVPARPGVPTRAH